MNNFINTKCKNARIRDCASLINRQSSSLFDSQDKMCWLENFLAEQVYGTLKRICREIITQRKNAETMEHYKVFDGDKNMKRRLYKCFKKYNSRNGNKNNRQQLRSYPNDFSGFCNCCELDESINKRSRRNNRIGGGHDSSNYWDKKKKGIGKSKLKKIRFDDESEKKFKKRSSCDKSYDGRMKAKVKRKRTYDSDNGVADGTTIRKRKRKLKKKISDCKSDKNQEENRAVCKDSKKKGENVSEEKKKNNKFTGRMRTIEQKSTKNLEVEKQKDGGDLMLTANEKEETNPILKNIYLIKAIISTVEKYIGMKKGREKGLSFENYKDVEGKQKNKIKGIKNIMERNEEKGNMKQVNDKSKRYEQEEKTSSYEEIQDSDESRDSEYTDETEKIWKYASISKGQIALISDLHLKFRRAKRSYI